MSERPCERVWAGERECVNVYTYTCVRARSDACVRDAIDDGAKSCTCAKQPRISLCRFHFDPIQNTHTDNCGGCVHHTRWAPGRRDPSKICENMQSKTNTSREMDCTLTEHATPNNRCCTVVWISLGQHSRSVTRHPRKSFAGIVGVGVLSRFLTIRNTNRVALDGCNVDYTRIQTRNHTTGS